MKNTKKNLKKEYHFKYLKYKLFVLPILHMICKLWSKSKMGGLIAYSFILELKLTDNFLLFYLENGAKKTLKRALEYNKVIVSRFEKKEYQYSLKFYKDEYRELIEMQREAEQIQQNMFLK